MLLIDLIKVMPDEERIVIWENPRKKFAVSGIIENLMQDGDITTQMLEKEVLDVGYSSLYSAIGIEIDF